MKERPILFKDEMVRAILEGRKTQTRRPLKLSKFSNPHLQDFCVPKRYQSPRVGIFDIDNCGSFEFGAMFYHDETNMDLFCKSPYEIGDQIWVKETHYQWGNWVRNGVSKSGKQKWKFHCLNKKVVQYLSDSDGNPSTPALVAVERTKIGWHKRPSLFMPVWACRLKLEITDVGAERLQDITEEDAIREGINQKFGFDENYESYHVSENGDHRTGFMGLWDALYKSKGFGIYENPWVWVIEFSRVNA